MRRLCYSISQLRFAASGGPFDQDWPPHGGSQKHGCGGYRIRDIAIGSQFCFEF
jgi:hypothetical protein